MIGLRKVAIVFLLAVLALGTLFHRAGAEEKNFWVRDVELKKNSAIVDYGEKYENAYFRIFYRRPDATLQYVKFIADTLLKVRSGVTRNMAYQEPEWLKGRKLDVYLKDMEPYDLFGLATQPVRSKFGNIVSDSWIEITLEPHLRKYYSGGALWYGISATTRHEYFHIVQFGYDSQERDWLMEATATWLEDKTFPVPEKFWWTSGHRRRIKNWLYDKPFVSNFDNQEYAASLFFQYLTERRPGGDSRVRNIWEEAAKIPGNSAYQAISKVLGDSRPWGPKTRAITADFAVAAFIRDPKHNKTYSFRKLKGLSTAPITENLQMSGNTLGTLKGNTLWPMTRALKPFQIGYYEIVPPETVVLKDEALKNDNNLGRLIVEINADVRDRWEFRLIEFPRSKSDPAQWRVSKFSKTNNRQGWNRLVVEDYPKSRAVLVAINFLPSLKDEDICAEDDVYMSGGKKRKKCPRSDITPDAQFKIAAAFFNPPVVKSLTVEYPDSTGQHRKVWKIKREKTNNVHGRTIWRTRTTLTEGIRYRGFEDRFSRINFLLETNMPVATSLKLFVAEKLVYLRSDDKARAFYKKPTVYLNRFSGALIVRRLNKAMMELEASDKQVVFLPVKIIGQDWWGRNFDVNPATAPTLKIAGKDRFRIENWEDGTITLGGDDVLGDRKIPFHLRDPAPYLAKISVHQKTTQIYKAEWTPDKEVKREGMRQLVRGKSKPFDPEKPLRFELTFDSPVKDVIVALGPGGRRLPKDTVTIQAPNPPDRVKSVYQLEFPPSAKLKKILGMKNQIVIFVSAVSQSGTRLDGDPRSPAWYDYDEKRWYWLEEDKEIVGKGAGGPDRWHSLKAQGRSIMLVLDASGSMDKQMPSAKQGIIDAVRTLRSGDEVALMVFGGSCDVWLAVPFTENPEDIVKAIRDIMPDGGTPLGKAILAAYREIAKSARYRNHKLLVFSDGEESCGADVSAIIAGKKDPEPPVEDKPVDDEPEKTKWIAYKIEAIRNQYFPRYRVIEIEYYQEKGKQNLARLTMRRYPVSVMSSRGRTLWSINWSNRKVTERKEVRGGGVDRLRARAEAMRENTMSRDKVRQAVQETIGPGAVALKR